MQSLMNLVKRNMNLYLRNRSSVLFSFLSMVIILVLNMIFLGDVNEAYLANFVAVEENQVVYMTGSWLMAGIIIVNVVMVTLSALGIMVKDEEDHKIAAFLVAPISRTKLIMSYIIAACVNAFILSIVTLGLSQVYLYISCKSLLSLAAILKLVGVILATIFSLVTFLICIILLVHSKKEIIIVVIIMNIYRIIIHILIT